MHQTSDPCAGMCVCGLHASNGKDCMLIIIATYSGFDSYYKIVMHGHIGVLKFLLCEVSGLLPRSIYHLAYLLPSDFLTIFPRLVLI